MERNAGKHLWQACIGALLGCKAGARTLAASSALFVRATAFRATCYVLMALVYTCLGSASPATQGETWSDDLLSRLLAAPESGAAGQDSQPSPDGMVLRSYQLRSLRVGDPGRAANLISILRRMLPVESRVTEDPAANMLHVLSSATAQDAVLELISAMDAEAKADVPPSEPTTIPAPIKSALESLASSRPDAEQLKRLLSESSQQIEQRVSRVVDSAEKDSRARLQRALAVGAVAVVLVVAGTLFGLTFILKRNQQREIVRAAKRETTSLALLPTQSMEAVLAMSKDQQERARDVQKLMESFSIAYQADRQRNSMVMEAVAKRHAELSATVEQMQHLRREIGEGAGRLFLDVNRAAVNEIIQQASDTLHTRAVEVGLIAESASRKMEETASRLEVQNAKAEALATELERTQREVDGLFDKLRAAQEEARLAQNEAHEQRRIAAERAADLSKKEAALAGLSLLMQEPVGDILDTLNETKLSSSREQPGSRVMDPPSEAGATENVPDAPPVTDHAPMETSMAVPQENDSCSNPRYTFQITPVV